MFRSYFKLAIRNLFKNKLFTAIKLIGFIVGFTSCLLIGLYLQHELTYDKCHIKSDRVVRVYMEYSMSGASVQNVAVTGNKVAPSFASDFPEVESAVRIIRHNQVVKYEDHLFDEEDFYYADSTLFEIFTFSLLQGDPREALNEPGEVVLSSEMAEKYFGSKDPIGQELWVGNRQNLKVTGVFEPLPANSQIKPDFVGSFLSLRDSRPERLTWWRANYATFLLLQPNASIQSLNAKIPAYMAGHARETGMEGNDYLSYRAEPLERIHLYSTVPGNFEPNGDIRYVYILAIIGLLILLIGGTTYVNLTTAASTDRAREIGIHKVLGAGRGQLFIQHLSESVVLTAFALLVSYILLIPLAPLFNTLIDRSLSLEILQNPTVILGAITFGMLVSLFSGIYPAIIASNFRTANVLKGNYKATTSGAWLHKSLIVFQYSFAALLIICTVGLNQQLRYVQNKKLGYNKDRIIVLPADDAIVKNIEAIKTEFKQNTNVLAMSLAYETPVDINGGYDISQSMTGQDSRPVRAIPVDEDFAKTIELEIIAGRDLNAADIDFIRRRDAGTDSTSALPILINESQARDFGWSPEEGVNQFVYFAQRAQIKGVFKDFHFESLHEPIGNLVIFPATWGRNILVRIGQQDLASTMSFLNQKWGQLVQHRPFNYHFMNEEFDQLYSTEIQTARLVTSFSLLAILLAFLGLFGLATFSIVQKTKEIGIRKVLGATIAGVVFQLSRDFLKLVLIALVVASPVGWFLMKSWLDNFTYRINVEWWIFGLAAFATILIAFLAVGLQSIKAALANPIESLRNE